MESSGSVSYLLFWRPLETFTLWFLVIMIIYVVIVLCLFCIVTSSLRLSSLFQTVLCKHLLETHLSKPTGNKRDTRMVCKETEIDQSHMKISCHLLPLLLTNRKTWQRSGNESNEREIHFTSGQKRELDLGKTLLETQHSPTLIWIRFLPDRSPCQSKEVISTS